MITVRIGQTKSGVIVLFDEPDNFTKAIRLSWHEAAGLKHAINEACEHPLFKERDPKSQKKEVRFQEGVDAKDIDLRAVEQHPWRQP